MTAFILHEDKRFILHENTKWYFIFYTKTGDFDGAKDLKKKNGNFIA